MTAYARCVFRVQASPDSRLAQIQPADEAALKEAAGTGATPDGAAFVISMRSVNSRFLDINLNLPRELRAFQDDITRLVRSRLDRGKVDLGAEWLVQGSASSAGDADAPGHDKNDPEAAEASLEYCIGQVRRLYRLPSGVPIGPVDPVALLALAASNKIARPRSTENTIEFDWNTLNPCFQAALAQFEQSRQTEGDAIQGHLRENIASCDALLEQIGQQRQHNAEMLRTRLLEHVEKLKADHDPARLEEELLYSLKRHDVEEEHNRLAAHLLALKDVLGLGASDTKRASTATAHSPGKRIGFLVQEMVREANTIGSKSPSHETSMLSIEVKLELERIREQAANLE